MISETLSLLNYIAADSGKVALVEFVVVVNAGLWLLYTAERKLNSKSYWFQTIGTLKLAVFAGLMMYFL